MIRGLLSGLLFSALLLIRPLPCLGSAAFSELDGAVEQRPGDDAPWEKPTKGAVLPEGARLRVPRAARAEVVFDDISLMALGSETEVILRRTALKGRAVTLSAGSAIVKLQKDAELEVAAPRAVVTARGARFLMAVAADGSLRTRVFSGSVVVKDAKGRAATVSEQAGNLVPIPGSGWLMEPPRGYQAAADETGLPFWKRSWQENVGVAGVPLVGRHTETVTPAVEEIQWVRGQPWPQDCRNANSVGNAVLEGTVRQEAAAGIPAFSYSCVVPGGLKYMDRTGAQPVWRVSSGERHRYRDVALDYNGRTAAHAVWLRYSHIEEVDPVPGLEPEKMDDLRRFVGMTKGGDRDGSGADAFFETLETLRPAVAPAPAPAPAPQAPQQNPPASHAVPLFR